MKRRRTTLIVLAVLTVLLAVLYAGLKLSAAPEEDTDAPDTATLISVDREQVQTISYTCGETQITLVKAGEVWQLQGDPDFPLDTQQAGMMLGSICSVTSNVPVAAGGDDALFGLDEPSAIITVTLADGTRHTLTLGDLNGFNDRYYARVDGVDGVYMVESKYYRYFSLPLEQLAVPDAVPTVRSSGITGVTVAGGENLLRLEAYDPAAPQVYSESFPFVIAAPDGTVMGADPNNAAVIVTLISGLATTDCFLYGATEADFAACGLDGSKTIRVDYTTGEDGAGAASWMLTVGDLTEDGTGVYVRLNDSKMICRMESAAVTGLLAVTPDLLRTLTVCDLSLTELDAMTLTAGDSAPVEFTVDHRGTYTADYYMDGQKLSSDSFKSFFTTISTLKAVGYAETGSGGELLLKIEFSRSTDAFSQPVLALYDLGDGTCRAEFAGMTTQLVALEDVQTILTALEGLEPA